MSNTFKTKPLVVLMANRKEGQNIVGVEEHHDHRDGQPCDLPERVDPKDAGGRWSSGKGTRCEWHWTYKGVNLCGCKMCSGQDERRVERRMDRHRKNEDLNVLKKTLANVDLEDSEEVLDAYDVVDARYRKPGKW